MNEEAQQPDLTPGTIWRLRLIAICVGLMAVAFSQAPGRIVADTKFALLQDPGAFLSRSLSLWDPTAAFGQLQNQAYGYLFPMGPFFWLGHSVGLPAWVVQRLWWSLLLIVAFLGMWKLSGALVNASPWARIGGSLVYALSPRILAELTVTSIEVWPMAVAPWVLWPLVDRGARTWGWRIGGSALAVLCLGGVNAVASGAALVLPVVWFLTRRPNWQTLRWAALWMGAVIASILWWLGPLIILGRYSPPFLDWIEGISVTSSTASVFESIRGTSAWLGFLLTNNGPTWPGGFVYVSERVLILVTLAVVAAGLVGLGLRGRVQERVFLVSSLLLGLLLLTAGHEGATRSIASGFVRDLLDGAVAPLRNLHKFDLVVRIPLSLGVVAAVDALARLAKRRRLAPALVPAFACLGILSLGAPAVVGNLARPEAFVALPSYWEQAAEWLDEQPDEGAVLVLPAAGFADFEWGSTKDNPLQSLTKRAFVHRDAVPLGSAGATRFLDGIASELGSGQGGPHVVDVLATAGIRYVLVPNDLRRDVAGNDLVRIHSALEKSGLRRAAAFGNVGSTIAETDHQTVDFRSVLHRPRIEVFDVEGSTASAQSLADTRILGAAGPENLVTVSRALGDRLLFLASDGDGTAMGARTAMDGLRAREVDFGQVTNNRSHLFQRDEQPRQDRRQFEYAFGGEAPRTVQGWDGVERVSASSSASDAGANLRLGPGYGPAAALDGDPATGWVSGRLGRAVGEWLQVDFTQATQVGEVRLETFQQSNIGALPSQVRIETENGTASTEVFPNGRAILTAPTGVTAWMRIVLETVGEGLENGFGIAEVTLDERLIGPRTQVPPVPDDTDQITLSRELHGVPACVHVDDSPRCNPEVSRIPEERSALRRELTVESGGRFVAEGWVLPSDGDALDEFHEAPGRMGATASSRLVSGHWLRPSAAVDGDLATGWVAGTDDFGPRITISLPEPRVVDGLQFIRNPSLPASRPHVVDIRFSDGSTTAAEVDDEGFVRFPPRETNRILLKFGATKPLVSISSQTGVRVFAPVGASEIRVLGAEDLTGQLPPSLRTGAPCGFGPAVVVNGVAHATQVSGSLSDMVAGSRLRWEVCDGEVVVLEPGRNVVDLVASGEFVPDSLTLTREGAATSVHTPRPASAEWDGASRLQVALTGQATDQVVTIAQNYNDGWVAVGSDNRPLAAVRLNGWMQSWVVPPGETAVRAEFAPDRTYRSVLLAGGLAALALGLSSVLARRRVGYLAVPPAEIRVGRLVALAAMTLAGLLIGGVPLALAAGTGWLFSLWADRRSPRTARWIVSGTVLVLLTAAGIVASSTPWPAGRGNIDSLLVQVLVFSAVTLASASAVRPWLLATGRRSERSRDVPISSAAAPSGRS